MPRISGVDIPPQKIAKIALRYIFGVGPVMALNILKEAGIDPEIKAKDITDEQVARLNSVIERNYVVEGQLRRPHRRTSSG